MMPDLDGWSVLAALRQDPELADIPVIMVTIVDEHRRRIALGAAGYLTKPIDRERLHRLVTAFGHPHHPPASCWWKTMPSSASGYADGSRVPNGPCERQQTVERRWIVSNRVSRTSSCSI
jgi:CheY-like chemotaxis protein